MNLTLSRLKLVAVFVVLAVAGLAYTFWSNSTEPTSNSSESKEGEQKELTEEQQFMLQDIELSGGKDCPESPSKPLSPNNEYQIVDSCLYAGGELVFETTLTYQLVMGEFGTKGTELIYFPMYADHALGSVRDWFWFRKDGKVYFYFRAGGESCMGCEMPAGPRIVLDAESGEVLAKETFELPLPYQLIRSEDYSRAIHVKERMEVDEVTGEQSRVGEELSVLSFIDPTDEELFYTVPDGATLRIGNFCFPTCPYQLTWTGDNTISANLYKTDEAGLLIQAGVSSDGSLIYEEYDVITLSVPE